MQTLVERVLEQAVVRALDDAETQVVRMSHRVEPRAVGGLPVHELESSSWGGGAAQNGQVVDRVDRLDVYHLRTAEVVDALGDVAIGVEHELRDDVVIRHHAAGMIGEETRADHGLGARPLLGHADLDDRVRKAPEDGLGRRRGPCAGPAPQDRDEQHEKPQVCRRPRARDDNPWPRAPHGPADTRFARASRTNGLAHLAWP